MTRIVGQRNRSEFNLHPAEALRQGRIVDAMLAASQPRRMQGILRGTHRELNALDDLRQVETARLLNGKR